MGRVEELGVLVKDVETFTPRKLVKKTGWTGEEVTAAVTELEEIGAISPIGVKKSHYVVNHERLEELLASNGTAAAEGDTGEPETLETPEEPDKDAKVGKTKLVNKLPTSGKSGLAAVLARIKKIPKAQVFSGEELEAKLNEVVEKLGGIVCTANECIKALEEKAPDVICFETDQISLRRVIPAKSDKGPGGVVAEYSSDGGRSKSVLFERPWAKCPTEAWFRHLEKDLEAECAHMLGRMAKYVEKHNKR